MRKSFVLAIFFCFAVTSGFAQNRLNGKWATERTGDPLTISEGQRKQRIQLEVTIEDAKASGTLSFGGLGGKFYTFKDGKVTDNKVQFRTNPRTDTTWTIEIVDDTTVMLYHPPLELVGDNVLDLISILSAQSRVQAAAVTTSPVTPGAASAQADANAPIRGVVQDQSKAMIPGATVEATNVDTGATLTTHTNDSGRYSFPGLRPGKYTFAASVSGFKTKTVSDLSIGDTQILQDFTLEFSSPVKPTAATCGQKSIMWCTLLHRGK